MIVFVVVAYICQALVLLLAYAQTPPPAYFNIAGSNWSFVGKIACSYYDVGTPELEWSDSIWSCANHCSNVAGAVAFNTYDYRNGDLWCGCKSGCSPSTMNATQDMDAPYRFTLYWKDIPECGQYQYAQCLSPPCVCSNVTFPTCGNNTSQYNFTCSR